MTTLASSSGAGGRGGRGEKCGGTFCASTAVAEISKLYVDTISFKSTPNFVNTSTIWLYLSAPTRHRMAVRMCHAKIHATQIHTQLARCMYMARASDGAVYCLSDYLRTLPATQVHQVLRPDLCLLEQKDFVFTSKGVSSQSCVLPLSSDHTNTQTEASAQAPGVLPIVFVQTVSRVSALEMWRGRWSMWRSMGAN